MASQVTEKVTAHAQSDSLEDAREIRADGTYFANNLCIYSIRSHTTSLQYMYLRPINNVETFGDV